MPSPQLRIASVNGALELFMFSQKSVAKALEKFDQQ